MSYGDWLRQKGQAAVSIAAVLTVSGLAGGLISGNTLGLAPTSASAEKAVECVEGTAPVHVPTTSDDQLLCLPVGGPEVSGSRVDPTYGQVATDVIAQAATASDAVTARTASVVCWSEEDWARIGDGFEAAGKRDSTHKDGFVDIPNPVANLSPDTCQHLDWITYDGKRYESSMPAIAVGTLAHEAIHVAAIADEAIAECYGAQLVAVAADGMGASVEYGTVLEELYWDRNRWFLPGTNYDDSECRVGGALALALSSTAEAATPASAPAVEAAGCPTGSVRVTAEQIGTEPPRRCLPVRGGPFGASREEASRIEPLFSSVATDVIARASLHTGGLAVRDAVVVCWSVDDWERIASQFNRREHQALRTARGFVWTASNVINLSVEVCPRLSQVAYEGRRPSTGLTAVAIGTLAHEAMHVAGIADEEVAQCYALQLTAHVTRLLGANSAYASRMSELRWNYHQEHWQGSEYDDPACHDGGPLDLELAESSRP